MSSRFIKLLLVIFIVALVSYIFLLNPTSVTVNLGSGAWTAPLALVLIAVFFLGVFLAAVVSLLFGVRYSLQAWRDRRRYQLAFDHLRAIARIREQIAAGQFEHALPQLKKIISQDPENILARNMLAEALQQRGELGAALRALDEARLAQKRNLELLFRGSEIQAELGNFTAAYDNLVLVLHADADNRPALEGLVGYSEKLGRYREAVEFQQRLIRLLPGDEQKRLQRQLADLEFSELRNTAGDLRHPLEAFLKRHRDYAPGLAELARLERNLTDLPEATKLWTRAFRASPDLSYLEAIALTWMTVEQPEKAIEAVRAALGPTAPAQGELFLVGLLREFEMQEEARRELEQVRSRPDLTGDEQKQVQYFEALFAARDGKPEIAFRTLEGLLQDESWAEMAHFFHRLRKKQPGDPDSTWSDATLLKLRSQEQPSPLLSTP